MARQRKLTPECKAFINGLFEHYQLETAQDVQCLIAIHPIEESTLIETVNASAPMLAALKPPGRVFK